MSDDPTRSTAKVVTQKMTQYRWVVLVIICVFYLINFADRTNIGVVLPMIRQEYNLSNFEAGSLMSFFFLGYAVTQIPAGLFMSRFGTRGMVSMSILGFSLFTYFIGTSATASMMRWFRLGLGLCEGPAPVGGSSTIKNWYPPHEQATAAGLFMGSASLALVATPPIAVWIMVTYGWRYVFYWFAVPGVLVAIVWYLMVHSRPEESPYCNEAEVAYIRQSSVQAQQQAVTKPEGSLGWIDKIIRRRKVKPLDTNISVFKSWNIWGIAFTYFFVNFVSYGMMTWIPTFLVTEKGYSFVRMGFVAAAPWLGAMLGQMCGGWFSDKILLKRRKPLLMFAPISLVIMMGVLINAPNNVVALAVILFLTGFFLHSAWGSFFAYPMGLTSGKTYPTAISIMTSVGNFSGFFSPMIGGYLLDVYKTFDVVFIFLACCAFLALLTALTIEEPIHE